MKRVTVILVVLLAVLPLQLAHAAPPGPGGLSPDLWVFLVEGPLPWSLPTLPDTDTGAIVVPTVVGPTVSASYTSNMTDLDDEFQDYEDELDDYQDTLDTLRNSVNAPTSAGNFDPGLEPDGSPTTLYSLADAMGDNTGTLLTYLRVLRVTNINSSGAFFAMLFVSLAWVFFVLFAKVIIGVASDLFGLVWKLWEAIPFLN